MRWLFPFVFRVVVYWWGLFLSFAWCCFCFCLNIFLFLFSVWFFLTFGRFYRSCVTCTTRRFFGNVVVFLLFSLFFFGRFAVVICLLNIKTSCVFSTLFLKGRILVICLLFLDSFRCGTLLNGMC